MYRTDEYGFLFSDPLCKKGWNREEESVLPSRERCCFGGCECYHFVISLTLRGAASAVTWPLTPFLLWLIADS